MKQDQDKAVKQDQGKVRGMGRVFQRGGRDIWWVYFHFRGKEYRLSSGSRNKNDAERFLAQQRDKVGADRLGLKPFIPPRQDRVRVNELLNALETDYRLRSIKSWPQFQAHLKPIRKAFGHLKAVEITEDDVDRYIEARRANKSVATVNRETQLLGQALRRAVKGHRLSGMPTIRHLPERNVRRGFFERGDFEALVKVLPESLRDFTRFAYLTGWRRGEIASLTWADVDLNANMIRLRPEASKTGEGRTVALEGDLRVLIDRRWSARHLPTQEGARIVPWVFHRRGRPIKEFRKAWVAACKKTKLEGRLFHDLRRTAIRNMTRAGVSQAVAMAISGHRTASVFRRYDITTEADIREAMQKTQEYVDRLPTERTLIPFPYPDSGPR